MLLQASIFGSIRSILSNRSIALPTSSDSGHITFLISVGELCYGTKFERMRMFFAHKLLDLTNVDV